MDRWERLVGDQPGAVGEPIDGVSASARTGDHYEVDRVAAVIAGPASPTLMASMIAVQRDRGPVVVVVGRGAMPTSARPVALGGLSELVEEYRQVGAVEHVADVPSWAAVIRDVHREAPTLLDRCRTKSSRRQ